MKYLAHISEDGSREQTVVEHVQNVASMAKTFAKSFHAESWGYCCGLLHDIGKFSCEFQRRLQGGASVDHSTASAIELTQKRGAYALAAYCTAGHHAGLPDGGTAADGSGAASLCGRLKKKVPDYLAYKEEITIPPLQVPSVKLFGKGGYTVSFFIRMIYSCLVDADFLDTEEFMSNGITERKPERVSEVLLEKLFQHTDSWRTNTNLMTVNGRRTEILNHCLRMGLEQPGLYSLTVPTGGGKTVSSLAFALQHACTYGKERIIYVIPYTGIIEQTANVFREILGDDQVLENHSNVHYDDREEFKPMQLAAENWDKPVIVTTNVQFFESLFSNKSSKCRKLHNIANSVIVFDEAQMIPIPYLKPCIQAITELVANYESTVVLCTATQPSLQSFFPAEMEMRELCPRVAEQFEFFKRTSVENIGTIEEEELLRRLRSEQSTLCIMNNRKRVQSIYHQLNGNGVYHLSTYMYPEHRKRILAEIRARLKEKKKCIVIATSLVEAGVDLDFDTVYRELAGIDSVVQAAGRCNREGKRPLEDSKTYVFQLAKKMFLPTELKQPMEIAKIVAEQFENIASLEAIQKYFELLHYIKGDELDKKRILEQFEKGAKTGNYPFASVAAEFRLIEAKTRMIVIGKEEKACELAERLRLGERSRTLLREAGHYSIQVYENDFEKLRAAGDLEELDQEVALLRSLDKYSEESGMNMDVEFGAAVFL